MSWRLAQREASQTPKLYDHSGAKKGFVWHYFGFIKAKDGPATKTYLDMTKAMYKLYRKSYTNQGEHAFNNKYVCSYLNNDHLC